MLGTLGLDPFILATAVAIGIGLLVGLERERSKGSGPDRGIGGIRTFAVVSLLGLLSEVLAIPFAFVTLAIAIAAITVAAYLRSARNDPGITTEVALLATFVLGASSLTHPAYSAGTAVVLTILLASRSRLHDIAKARLSDREVHDGLLLLAAALVVLPLLPDRTLDPLHTINPRKLWMVVVLVMSVNAVAYIALRTLGLRNGLLLAGLLGGFVSSISTHAAMGQRVAAQPALAMNAVAAASLSSLATAVLLLAVLSAVHVPLAIALVAPLAAAAVASGGYTALLYLRSSDIDPTEVELGRPLSLRPALIFAVVLTCVLVVTSALTHALGSVGALASIALAGFADSHSAAISAAVLDEHHALPEATAQLAVLLALTTNSCVKIVVSYVSGTRTYGYGIALGTSLSVACAWLVWLLL